ncbi:hypothetical protein [Microvirga tunisiensis]|uniref:hypothetical protein n=1 Tax=Microvirga tunisiensis TaxID=2108360 RepID=UPI0013A530C4|nr:hypothetical protein [Microvirga tunisiensis]
MSAQSTKPETRAFTIRAVKAIAAFERTNVTDTLLGMALTFVAGAINAGGFLAVGQYTSHRYCRRIPCWLFSKRRMA